MGLGGGSVVSNVGSTTSTTGSVSSQNTSPLGFAQEANTAPQTAFDMSKDPSGQLANDLYSERVKRGTEPKYTPPVVQPIQEETSRLDNLGKGLSQMYEGVLKIPRFVYGLAAVPQNFLADKLDMPQLAANYDDFLKNTNTPIANSPLTMLDQLADHYKGDAEAYDKKTRKYDENIISTIGKGNFKEAGSQILDQIIESAPSIAGMAMTSGAGGAANLGTVTKTLANGLPFMSQKNAQLQDDTSVPEWKKPLVAGFNGLAEVMLDQKYGTQAAIEGVVRRFTTEGAEAALEAGKDIASSYIKKALNGTSKAVKPLLEGGIEEASTQFAQNMLDKYALGKDIDLMDGVADAAIVGGAMTGGITTAGNVASKIVQPKERSQVRDIEGQQVELLNELSNPNLSPEAQSGVEQLINDNQNTIEGIAKKTQEAIAKLNPEQKKEVETLSKKIEVAEAVVNDPNVGQVAKDVAEKQIDQLGKEIDAIKPEEGEAKATKEPTGTPVKKGTDVAIDDTVELVNGKKGKVTKVEGDQVTMTMENGATFMATPELVDMSVIKPSEAVQETKTPEVAQEPIEVKETLVEAEKQPLVLFHGTPHKFEGFKTNKIGTGEGNQAFGAGLYFTNQRNIAEGYANDISSKQKFWNYLQDGNDIELSKDDYELVNNELDALGFDGSRAEDAGLSEIIVDGKTKEGSAVYDALSVLFGKNAKSALEDYGLTSEQIDRMLAIKKKITDPQLYQVSIKNDSKRDFMSWEEPLTDKQKSSISDVDGDTGKEVYNALVSRLGSQQKASEYLSSKGIDGIIYKSNKGTGGKSGDGRNYVIFDDNAIKIDKINDNEIKQPESKEVVTEDISEKRTKEVLDKANTDLEALKQVNNKPAKYQASVKRLTDAFKAGYITEQEFNDTKARFDDVIIESSHNVPKKETLSKQETEELNNELINEDLTADDFIEYERARAIEDANISTETVQQPKDDTTGTTGEVKPSEEAQAVEQETAERLATIPEDSPSVTDSRKAGDPLRSFATKIRQGKINKLGGFKTSTGFDGAWDLGVEAVALSLEGGAKVADAIESGLKAIKKTDWYKNLDNKDEFDTKYKEHMEAEYAEEEKKATKLRNKDIAEKRSELGLEERTRPTRKSNQELVEEANTAIKDGYDVESLIDNIIEGRKEATDKEVVILKQYQLAKEDELIQIGDKIVESTEQGKGTPLERLIEKRDMIIQDIQRAYEAGEKTGTVSARALQARKIALMNDYSLAGMLIEKRKANGDQALSAEQIDETTAEYTRIKKLNDELQAKINELQEQNKDLRSKKQIESLKTILAYEKRKLGRVEQRESIQNEIDKAKEALSKKLKEQRSTLSANPIPVNLIPDIAKLGKLYAQRGINTLEGIADAIYVDLKESIDGLKKDDVEEVLLNFDYDTQAKEEKRLEGFKLRTAKRTQELRDRLNAMDFSRRKIEPVVLDAEAKKLQEELRRAKFDWEHGLERDILARRTRLEKVRDAWTEIMNVPRALMATLDYSAPLRQGLVLTINNPVTAGKAFVEMFRQSWSEKRFENWLADLRESPDYADMKEAGLYIADHNSPKLSAREEQFMSNLINKIPFLGRTIKIPFGDRKIEVGGLVKGAERAYVSYLNKLRVDVFRNVASEFEKDGKTLQSDKKLYEALSTYINTATGRGNLGQMEGSAQILNSAFFSPRLIASRIRLLTNWANPVWYANTPEPVRVMYMRDMAKTIAVGTTLLALAGLAGADVEDDPRSSDFGKIRIGDKRWDIWGGFQQFVRFFSQLATGQRKSTSDKTIREINGEGFKGETRADLIINMIRSKLAPVPATAWNLAAGENMVGEEYTWKDVPQSFLPLFAADLYKATDKDGIKGFLGSGVGIFGVGVQDYSKKEDKPKSMDEIKKELREQLRQLKDKK